MKTVPLRSLIALPLLCTAALAQTVLYTPSGTVSTSSTGNVGIGNPSPAALLTVGQAGTADNGTAQFNIDPTVYATSGGANIAAQGSIQAFTNASTTAATTTALMLTNQFTPNGVTGTVSGIWTDVYDPSSNSVSLNFMRGATFTASHLGSGNAGLMMGAVAIVNNSSTAQQAIGVRGAVNIGEGGTISTVATGLDAQFFNSSSTTVAAYKGLNIASIFNYGTITNTYGVYVGNVTVGTQTNHPFSFYASDTSAWNYFGGAVGIGTTNMGTYKLSVGGAIHATDVVVETGWADYVFDRNYKLQDLSEVERQIKQDKHLPGIPSAQEVAAHGVNVGEMQAKLLAKVEELTLYMIDLKKENAELRTEVENLKKQIQ